MVKYEKNFNAPAFFKALQATVEARGVTWKQVSVQTGVSTTTLARMATGRNPDAASLAALCAWAGLNIVDFVEYENGRRSKPETVAAIGQLLRTDPSLAPKEAEALESMFKAAYLSVRKPKRKT